MLKKNITFNRNFLNYNCYTVLKTQIQLLTNATLGVFYPDYCQICSSDLGSNEKHICLNCLYDLPFLYKRPDQVESLNQLFWGRADVNRTYALFNYQKGNRVQDILHLIKYKQKTKLAEHFGEKLGEVIKSNDPIDYILPIPLHPKKLRKRGFNQSTVIAKGISNSLKVPINEKIMKRVLHNPSQTTVSKYDRWENVRSIFEVKHPQKWINKHFLIVDDVLTTGATIEAAIQKLLPIEGCKVSVATLAARV